jgi:CBS-domain-containing membrane protein
MEIIDKSFLEKPKRYIIQGLMATAVVAIILQFVEALTHAVIIAALGASTFIVFAMPHSITARSRRLIGGHVVGLICGTICYYAFLNGPLEKVTSDWDFVFYIACALAVGLSIFLMTITNTEHPPAAATAISIVVYGCSLQIFLFIILSAVGLALARRLLKSRLADLF